jgi:hypothetical protein
MEVEVFRHSLDSSGNGLATMVADYSHNFLLLFLVAARAEFLWLIRLFFGGLVRFTQCRSQAFSCSEQALKGHSNQAS